MNSEKAHSYDSVRETTCDFDAFVIDQDSRGLNVREKPDAKSKLIGTIAPAVFSTPDNGKYLVKPELKVIAAKGGWFKIKGAKDNESLLEQMTGLKPRKMHAGVGWVSGQMLTVKSQANKGYSLPSKASAVLHQAAKGLSFDHIETYKLVGCQGPWVYVEDPQTKKNNRYWVDKICGVQETSCDGLGP